MNAAPPKPVPPPTLGMILLLGSLTAFGAVTIDLYLPALPTIARSFGADPAAAAWTMSAFFIGMALGQLVYGPLSDRYGRRPLLLVGAGVYVAASLACALAPDIGWLIAGRFAQALGAAAGQTIARAVVRDRYDHQDSARILSTLVLVLAIAPMLAPSAGSLLLLAFDWRAIFLALAAFGALLGVAVCVGLPESRSAATARQAAGEHPIRAYRELLGQRRLGGYLLAGALQGAVLFSYIAGSPELIIGIWGFSAADFAWLFPLLAVGVIGGSQLNRLLLRTRTPDAILRTGSLVAVAAGLALLLVAATGLGGVPGMFAALFVALSCYGVLASNLAAGALNQDPLRAGAISALIGATSFAAGALAASVAGALHDGTALPMAAVMAACLAGSAAALRWLAFPE